MGLIKCKECGHEVSKKAKTCPNCGNKTKPGVFKQIVLGLVGAFVIITVIGAFTDDSGGGPATTAEDEPVITVPSSQKAFVDAVRKAQGAADEASNDMAKGGVRATRADEVCQALGSSGRAIGWVGEIDSIDSNSEGKGVLSVTLARNVTVSTWNNAMSDIGAGTLIDPGTALFNTVSSMSEGDLVEFSGSFFANDLDCVSEQSITLDGSLDDPEYTMKFESVEPYTAG